MVSENVTAIGTKLETTTWRKSKSITSVNAAIATTTKLNTNQK